LCGYTIPLSVCILVITLIVWFAFWFIDRHWYHNLLIGSVKEGEALESALQANALLPISLTKTITKESRETKFLWVFKSKARHKLSFFYGGLALVIFLFLIVASLSNFHSSLKTIEVALENNAKAVQSSSQSATPLTYEKRKEFNQHF